MTPHLTAAMLQRFHAGELAPTEILEVSRHLTACVECAALAASLVDARRAAHGFANATLESGHPDLESDLTAYAEGRGSEAVAEHVAGCAICREDVDDIRGARPRRKTFAIAAAAAAVILLVLAAIAFWPRRTVPTPVIPTASSVTPTTQPTPPTPPTTTGYGRADWDRLVAEARASGVLPVAAVLTELRPAPDVFRDPAVAAAHAALQPAGEVVESTRPRFTWPATAGAAYVVSVYEGTREVARSATLSKNSWTPDRALTRGKTYAWQIEMQRDGATSILPAPPAPPAMFRVTDANAVRELDEARKRFPDDQLLLDVVHARHGITRKP